MHAPQDDPQKFVEEGGWDFLDLEKSDEEDEEDEESDGASASAHKHARVCLTLCPPQAMCQPTRRAAARRRRRHEF